MNGEVPPSREERLASRELLPAVMTLRPWADDVIDAVGFDPRSAYVEMCWLPTLGPSATWLYRRLALWAEANPEGVELALGDLALSIGLTNEGPRRGNFLRAMERLQRFEVARRDGQLLEVRRRLPPLALAQAKRLPPDLFRFHQQQVEGQR